MWQSPLTFPIGCDTALSGYFSTRTMMIQRRARQGEGVLASENAQQLTMFLGVPAQMVAILDLVRRETAK